MSPTAFTLRVTLDADMSAATLELLAPDGVVERQEQLLLSNGPRLVLISMFAQLLPQFLGAQAGSPNWVTLIGTDDANAYDAYLADALELLGPDGQGLTQPRRSRRARGSSTDWRCSRAFNRVSRARVQRWRSLI